MGRLTRRKLLTLAGAAGTTVMLHAGTHDSSGSGRRVIRSPPLDSLPSRIAFGSCAHQDQPQPIWNAVLDARPDLFIFLGDNIYGDTRDPAVLKAKYDRLTMQNGFRRLCERTPVLAIWDDHDFGENDAGGDYPMKEESRQLFCDFWAIPPESARRTRKGIYDAVTFAAEGRRLQILLPDLRFNRTALRRRVCAAQDGGAHPNVCSGALQEGLGPYDRNPEPHASMLGAHQWVWLEEQLAMPADIRILASSLQVVADFSGWEAWNNFVADHQRLLQSIRRLGVQGLVCISGDMHYAEVSRLDRDVPYPLWDFTSSGLTEVEEVPAPNALRVSKVLSEPNFGLLTIDWRAAAGPTLRFEARDARGRSRLVQEVSIAGLVIDTA